MTKITLTRETLIALQPCDRLRLFGDSDSMGVREAFDAGFTVSEVLWVAGRLGLAQDCTRVAIFAAKQVAHLNPDPRVGAALEAAQRCVDDPTPGNQRPADAAADAARAARAARAADANAAAAAADAARAARAADANAAAAAARAARAAYAAAAAAAHAAAYAAAVYADAAVAAAYAVYVAADAEDRAAAYAVRAFMVELWG